MKLFLKIFLFFLVSFLYTNSVYSLSDYQIKEICQRKQRKSNCIKNMKEKRSNLQKGKFIEIPVIPYKR